MSCNCPTCRGQPARSRLWCLQHGKHIIETEAGGEEHAGHKIIKLDVWRPPNQRLRRPNFVMLKRTALPSSLDLRPLLVSAGVQTFDQGSLGSCTANCGCYDKALTRVKQKAYDGPYSRLFLYWNEREILGTINEDSGADMVDIGEALVDWGVCKESSWPYTNEFTIKPYQSCYDEAKGRLDVSQISVTIDDVKQAVLNSLDTPNLGGAMFGYPVWQGVMNAATNGGWVSVPKSGDSLLGGHAELCVGWDDNLKGPDGNVGYLFLLQSWGNYGQTSSGISTWLFPYAAFGSATSPNPFISANGGLDIRQRTDSSLSPTPSPTPGTLSLLASPVTIVNDGSVGTAFTALGFQPNMPVSVLLNEAASSPVTIAESSGSSDSEGYFYGNLVYKGGYVGSANLTATDNMGNVSNVVVIRVTSSSICKIGNGVASILNFFASMFGRKGRFRYLLEE